MVVIHRDKSFRREGYTYRCVKQGPRGSGDEVYEVYREADGAVVGYFDRLRHVRAFVEHSQANGWPLVDARNPANDQEE